jgi:hypothetical protein
MNRKMMFGSLASVCAVAAVLGSIAIAEDKKPTAAAPEIKLPPGWTQEDMATMAASATPGEMHKHLAKSVGTWSGKTKMWMMGDGPAVDSACTVTVSSLFDGRYQKVEWAGEMPGVGPFTGQGVNGYDNAIGKFVSSWVDNWGTGITTGTGELSADGKTMTWTLSHNCPLTKKPLPMRQVETITGANTKTLVMFTTDPKSEKEFKMMEVELTRK